MRTAIPTFLLIFVLGSARSYAGSHSSSTATILFQYATSNNFPETGVVAAENGVFYGNSYNGFNNATIFTTNGSTLLTPSSFNQSFMYGGGGGYQVGYAPDSTAHFHPFVWSGTSTSGIDLLAKTLGMTSGIAYGSNATNVVGTESGFGNGGAALWTGRSATSIVDLGATLGTSQANACSGSQQVGNGEAYGSTRVDAYLWTGTAASEVDLSPTFGIQTNGSNALATNGTQQGGVADILYTPGSSVQQAMLWSGTAKSAVNLNPANVTQSSVLGMNTTMQVGWGDNDAYAWSGTAASAIDLGQSLPNTDTWSSSEALSISSNNVIYGIATDTNYNSYAVEWTLVAVPEPTCAALSAAACGLLLSRRRRSR